MGTNPAPTLYTDANAFSVITLVFTRCRLYGVDLELYRPRDFG